ncbi:MAG: tetratricopeptide repeat protein [Theionarchaea archaeon]|nr:tetratricopeptide repeat protein [Theionarchaea archaeon]
MNTMIDLDPEQLFFVICTYRYILEPREVIPAVARRTLVEISRSILSFLKKPLSTLSRKELEALIGELRNELKRKDIRLVTSMDQNKIEMTDYLFNTLKKGNKEIKDEISKNTGLEQEIQEVLTELDEALQRERALKPKEVVEAKRQEAVDLGLQGKAYLSSRKHKKAIENLEEALEIAEEIGDKRQQAVDLNLLGNAYLSFQDPEKAIECLERALEIAKEIGDKKSQAVDLNLLGNAYLSFNDPEKALEHLEEALKIDEEIGDKRSQAIDLNLLGKTYLSCKKHKKSVRYLEKALELDREIGDKKSQGIDLNLLGKAYLSYNNFKEAIENLEKALEIDKEIGDKRQQAFDLNSLGRVFEKSGQPQEAILCYERSLHISRELNDYRSISYNLYALGQIYYDLKDYSRAERYYEECCKLPSGTKPAILMNIYEKLGLMHESRRERKVALELYKKAHEFSRGKKRTKLERRIQNLEH